MEYVPNISGFTDFCSYHAYGQPIFWVNGQIYACFDMAGDVQQEYNFESPKVKKDIEQAIQNNMYMFDIYETDRFFMPNTNMFSGNNPRKYMKGQILVIKDKYIDKSQVYCNRRNYWKEKVKGIL